MLFYDSGLILSISCVDQILSWQESWLYQSLVPQDKDPCQQDILYTGSGVYCTPTNKSIQQIFSKQILYIKNIQNKSIQQIYSKQIYTTVFCHPTHMDEYTKGFYVTILQTFLS